MYFVLLSRRRWHSLLGYRPGGGRSDTEGYRSCFLCVWGGGGGGCLLWITVIISNIDTHCTFLWPWLVRLWMSQTHSDEEKDLVSKADNFHVVGAQSLWPYPPWRRRGYSDRQCRLVSLAPTWTPASRYHDLKCSWSPEPVTTPTLM